MGQCMTDADSNVVALLMQKTMAAEEKPEVAILAGTFKTHTLPC